MVMSLFQTLQEEVGEWSRTNFGDQPDVNPFLGTGEEAGELADDIDLDSPPTEEELDAIGDVLVYTADFCARRGLDYQAAYDTATEMEPEHADFFREWTAARGQLERSILKRRQGIDDAEKYADGTRVGDEAEQQALARVLCALETFVENRGYTLEECAQVAWYDEVIDREWDSAYN
jgi:NTP pyrophosphatase (non-canonical NTP hydrolase)